MLKLLEKVMGSNKTFTVFLKFLLLSTIISFSSQGLAACITAETESNNTDLSANYALCSGTAVNGSIGSSTDIDWLKFDVATAGTVSINLSHVSGADFDWYLYKASGSYVASSASSANPAIGSYSASTTGVYFIKIVRYAGTGNWTLNLSLPAPPSTGDASKVWLNGGAISQTNTGIFVNGLRQATGKNTTIPNINSTSNCDENWNTTPCPRVAIITAAALNQVEGVDKYTNDLNGTWSYANLFRRHGFAPKHILSHWDTYANNSVNTTTQGQANIAIINQADLVYVIGGDQSRLARTFLKDDGSDTALLAAIRTRFNAGTLIYAGDSAGTAIAPVTSYGEGISIGYLNQNGLRQITPANCPYSATAPSCLSNPDTSHPDYGSKIKGFGFVTDAIVDTHFDNRASRTGRLGRMVAALKNIGAGVAYGIDQDTALYLTGGVATVFGNSGVFIAEASGSNFGTGTAFTASNVRLSYLSKGDTYRRSDGVITTTKALISTPQFSGHLDSTNIFLVNASGLGNTSSTFKRMIDQTDSFNIGVAPADSANGDPLTFDLTFKKDATTQGYKSGTSGPYTIKKALLDIQ
jgi:cyanophycinase